MPQKGSKSIRHVDGEVSCQLVTDLSGFGLGKLRGNWCNGFCP